MTELSCVNCGCTVIREIPDHFDERWRAKLERVPPVCDACIATGDAEDERQRVERDQVERERRIRARRVASGVPSSLQGLTWSDVQDAPAGPLRGAQAWARGEAAGLLLTGPVGVGKTWLAAAAAWHRLDCAPVGWISVPALLARLSLNFADKTRDDALSTIAGTRALVLDDIDKARRTEYAAEHLFCAIDNRITAGAQLLVTTNLTLSALAERFPEPFGEAIVSRLAQHCAAFALEGTDRRLERFAS